MKKLNQKAFLMAETIIVAVFIMTLFTFIYANIIPLISRYESVDKYDDATSVFDANNIRNMIFLDIERNPSNNTLTKVFGGLDSSPYLLYENDELCNNLALETYCQTLFNEKHLNVKTIIVSSYKTETLKNNLNDFNREISDYLEYIPDFSSASGAYNSYKRLIVIFADGRMTNIEIKL